METTGWGTRDTVIFTCRRPASAILATLVALRNRWPEMATEVEGRVTLLGGNLPQLQDLQSDRVDVWVCRDPLMRHHQETVGTLPMSDGDGPVALIYRRRPSLTLRLTGVTEFREPEMGGPMPPKPYPAWLCSPNLYEVTLVSPGDPETHPFSAWLLEIVTQACLGQDFSGRAHSREA